jgi:hypothetical protein
MRVTPLYIMQMNKITITSQVTCNQSANFIFIFFIYYSCSYIFSFHLRNSRLFFSGANGCILKQPFALYYFSLSGRFTAHFRARWLHFNGSIAPLRNIALLSPCGQSSQAYVLRAKV